MAIASASTVLKLHDFPSGNPVHTYQPNIRTPGQIRSISCSKDGNWLALVPCSGPVEIVSVKEQPNLIHTIQGIQEPLCASFQNTTRRNIAVGTKTGQVLIYDVKAKKIKKTLPKASSEITKIEFTAKDGHVAVACETGEVNCYSNLQNNLSGSFKVPRSQSVSALRTNSSKRNLIVAGSHEGVVAVWDMHSNKHKFFNGSHKAPISGVAFSPICIDLVVSTGLDRQFCFYDISAGKCISSIFVETNMAAVDFSPDGKFVVMASQKGKIYIYDVKNTHQPLSVFEGHTGCIDNLLFRKCGDNDVSFNISSIKELEAVESDISQSININVTPSQIVNMTPSQVKITNSIGNSDIEDSFLAAMGLDHNTPESVKLSYQQSDSRKILLQHKFTPTNPSKLLQDTNSSDVKLPVTSTPDFSAPGAFTQASPIVSDGSKTIITNLEDVLKSTMNEIKNEIMYCCYKNMSENRSLILNSLMFNVKESIKLENNLNSLRSELLVGDSQSHQALMEENMMLKQRIAELEQQLAVMKMNGF